MQATLSELHRETRRVVRAVIERGKEVILTDFGRPVAKLVPYLPTKTFDDSEAMRHGTLTDKAILEAIAESRDEYLERTGT